MGYFIRDQVDKSITENEKSMKHLVKSVRFVKQKLYNRVKCQYHYI